MGAQDGGRERRTKIVATVGPASSSPDVLRGLVAAGVDVFRLNASHSDRDGLAVLLGEVRRASEAEGRIVAAMLDLSGPKLRLGDVAEGTTLREGSPFTLVASECEGDEEHACVSYPDLAGELAPGDRVLIDDGRVELRVEGTSGREAETKVVVGGPLKARKGVNLPGVTLSLDSITQKDEADLLWGLDAGVDLVAQSFVRSGRDVRRLRALMGTRRVPIVAKVEKHEAVDDMSAIVEAADAVMVARGDLAVETSPELVPVVQRRLISECRALGRPVVVATQMLESMTDAPRPTRAEASDVATAVFEQADAVMLSAETAVGANPRLVVETMVRIILAAEAENRIEAAFEPLSSLDGSDGSVTSAVSRAVVDLAHDLPAAAILTPTQSGATARAVACHRPDARIVAVTHDIATARRLAIVWGVLPIVAPRPDSLEELLEVSVEAVRAEGLARSGDLVAVTAGLAVNQPGATDSIQVRRIP